MQDFLKWPSTPNVSTKERWQSSNVCRLSGFEQSKPKRQLPTATHRYFGRQYNQALVILLHGRVLRLQSDQNGSRGYGKDHILDTVGNLLLQVMPFGLKNVGATYQRAMVTLFHDMMHKEIEVYVDDMIAKSQGEDDQVVNLRKLFE